MLLVLKVQALGLNSQQRKLEEGDIVNVDVTVHCNGVHGDLNETYFVGNVYEASKQLVCCAYECLEKAIAAGETLLWPWHRRTVSLCPKHPSLFMKQGCWHHETWANIYNQAKDKCWEFCNSGVWHGRLWPDKWTSVTTDEFMLGLTVTPGWCCPGIPNLKFVSSLQLFGNVSMTETGIEVLTARLPLTLITSCLSMIEGWLAHHKRIRDASIGGSV